MRQKLTRPVVKAALPGPKRTFIWDAGEGSTKGFGMKVMPSGTKVFLYQYRMGGRGTPTQRYTIGTFSEAAFPVDKARKIAEGLELKVAAGIDPNAEARAEHDRKRQAKAAAAAAEKGRVEIVAEEYLTDLENRDPPFRTASQRRQTFENDLMGTAENPGPWRGRLVSDIGRSDVRDALRRYKRSGRIRSVRNLHVAISAFFAYALEHEYRADNPARGIKLKSFGYEPIDRKRSLLPEELRRVWKAADKTAYPYGPFYKLLILTAQRRDEVAGMRRSELTVGALTPWALPPERSKNSDGHLIHLSKQALAVLAALPADYDLMFSGKEKKKGSNRRRPISGFSKAMREFRKSAGFSDWRLHDFRRTFATIASEQIKVPPHIIDKILNHRTGTIKGVAAVYNRAKYLDERQAALDAWGIYVATLAAGEGTDAARLAAEAAAQTYRDAMDSTSRQKPQLKVVSS